jgi:hypothetical protein
LSLRDAQSRRGHEKQAQAAARMQRDLRFELDVALARRRVELEMLKE